MEEPTLIDPARLRRLRDRWREKEQIFRGAAREANHEGRIEADAYRDGKSVIFAECADELDALITASVLHSQIDLPESAAKVLRENGWQLIDGVPISTPNPSSLRARLVTLERAIASMGISWNSDAGQEVDPIEYHPWIAGQCLARKTAAKEVQKVIDEFDTLITAEKP